MKKICKKHGRTEYTKRPDSKKSLRCKKCRSEAVSRRRKKVKELLVKESGGKCSKCGYNKYVGALVFHHTNPKKKDFSLSTNGLTRSFARLKKEANKCLLVCHNCHAEIHRDLY